MKPSSQMVESSLKKIKPTKVLQEASVVWEGPLEEVTFKKGLGGRVFKVEERASAQSHSLDANLGEQFCFPLPLLLL